MKKMPLVVGQIIWRETLQMFWRSDFEERSVTEYRVVEVNNSSAYAVSLSRIEEYEADRSKYSFMRSRIDQRSHKVKGGGFGDIYRLWLSEEAFIENVNYGKALAAARIKAHEIVDSMSLAGLENIIKKFE